MRLAVLFLLLAATAAGAAEVPQRLLACADSAEYPPYTYLQRADGKKTGIVTGSSVDRLSAALAAQGRSVEISLLPWKRCLAETQAGHFDLLMDVSNHGSRKEQFLVSASYATLTPILLYRSRDPLPIPRNLAQLDKLRRCDVLGWTTAVAYGREPASQPASMTLGFEMLAAGRCDAMLSNLEVIRSLDLIGAAGLLKDLAYHQLSFDMPRTVHFGVSRRVPYAAALLSMLNEDIKRPPAASPQAPAALNACGDAAGFAPYTYRRPDGTPDGYSVGHLESLLARSGRSVRVTLLPWKRCLLLASQGRYDIVLDAADLPERRRDFILTAASYTSTPVFVYADGREPPPLAGKAELALQRRCKVAGWDHSRSGSSEHPELIVSASTVPAALSMLRHGRCVLMHYQLELFKGYTALHGEAAVAGLSYRLVPWAPAASAHYAVSRATPYAAALAALLNEGIARLDQSDASARLLQRHLAQ